MTHAPPPSPPHAPPPARTPSLAIEPLVAAHADALFAPLADPRLYAYLSAPPPASVDALRAWIARVEHGRSADGAERWLNWLVRHRDDGAIVGTLQATVRRDGCADVAYMVVVAQQQRGFGRQALAWLVEHLASDPDVRRLRATVDPRNVASLALLRGAGFAVVAEVAGDPGDVVLARAP